MSKNKILIIVGIVFTLVIGMIIYRNVNLNNNLELLIKNNDYTKAFELIVNDKLLSDESKNETFKMLDNKLLEYKISSKEEYLQLNSDDLNNIKKFNELVNRLSIGERYSYLGKLVSIDDRLHDYIPIIKWYNSEDYQIYKKNMEVKELIDYEKSGLLMKDYSFDKYGLDNQEVKKFDDAIRKYTINCQKFSSALKNKDANLENYSKELQDNLYEIDYLEANVKTKNTDLENAINNLK